jgi:sporadic carbohydrate cluster 2OG-Fe(II) oxygenase
MYNNNYSKFEKNFINKGLIINKVEKKNALIYINEVIKKNLVKILKLNIKTKNFDLNKLHIYINERNINSVRLRLINAINKDTNFRNFFFKIAENMLTNVVGNELAMQNNINLSIQIPNDETSLLPIHSDTWSGDSPFESVLWVPMVNCYNTKSMFILNSKKIKIFNKIFSSKKIKSVSDLYKKFKKDLKFLKIKYGEYLLFNQNLPHGNLVNVTKETRVSLNCRFKGLFTPYSQKDLGSFFSPLKIRAATKLGLEYKLPGENN